MMPIGVAAASVTTRRWTRRSSIDRAASSRLAVTRDGECRLGHHLADREAGPVLDEVLIRSNSNEVGLTQDANQGPARIDDRKTVDLLAVEDPAASAREAVSAIEIGLAVMTSPTVRDWVIGRPRQQPGRRLCRRSRRR